MRLLCREVLGNHHRKSPQRWMELRLLSQLRMAKADQFWVVAAERSDAGRFIVHADQELPAFLELESAIPPLFLGAQQFSDSTIRELLL